MITFHTLCPEIAARETRSMTVVQSDLGLPSDDYAFIEFYCEDRLCDCRRVFIEVLSRKTKAVLASINFGWEKESFYRKKIPFDPEAPRRITRGWLDPLHPQSKHAKELLRLFQGVVGDASYCLRLKRHYQLFKSCLEQEQRSPAGQPQAT